MCGNLSWQQQKTNTLYCLLNSWYYSFFPQKSKYTNSTHSLKNWEKLNASKPTEAIILLPIVSGTSLVGSEVFKKEKVLERQE